MDQANVEEFGAALAGFEEIEAFLLPMVGELRGVTGESVVASFDGLLSSVDKAALTGTFADEMSLALRRAVETGIAGWRDDDLAFTEDWGFALSDIAIPVAVWQGRQDRMVPFAHGEWLAAEIPTAEAHLFDEEGHISLIAKVDEILTDLVALGR